MSQVAKTVVKTSVTRKHKRNYTSYRTFVVRTLKLTHGDELSIGRSASSMIEAMVLYLLDKFAEAISILLASSKKHTVTSREVMYAAKLVLPGELGKHAVSGLTQAVTKYNATQAASGDDRGSEEAKQRRLAATEKGHARSQRAGLIFPVTRMGKQLVAKVSGRNRTGGAAGIAIAAVIEYLISEVLELAGHMTGGMKHRRVTQRHIMLAVRSDEELDYLFPATEVVLPGGVVPHIHKSLIKKVNKKGVAKDE